MKCALCAAVAGSQQEEAVEAAERELERAVRSLPNTSLWEVEHIIALAYDLREKAEAYGALR